MARVKSQWHRFLSSIAEELISQSNRVRDLIGSKHWLTDGHHKEYLLAALLRRHLPAGVIATRGFVVSPDDPDACSNEQDILIVDATKEAPLFNQGDVIIAFPRTVLASVSVKTAMDKETVGDTCLGLKSVRDVAKDNVDPRQIWCGGYFFDVGDAIRNDPGIVYRYMDEFLKASPCERPILRPIHPYPIGPDMLCAAGDLAYRIDFGDGAGTGADAWPKVLGYRCDGMASALFVAQLLDHVAVARGQTEADFAGFSDVPDLERITPEVP